MNLLRPVLFLYLFLLSAVGFAQPDDGLYMGDDEGTSRYVQRYQAPLTPRCGSGTRADTAYDSDYAFHRMKSTMKLWEGQCRNGVLHGKWKQYYLDRPWVYIECDYVNGKRHGKEIRYRRTGSINLVIEYKNDSLNGYSRNYDDNGKLIAQAFYVNGKLHGHKFAIEGRDTSLSEYYDHGLPIGTAYSQDVTEHYEKSFYHMKTISVYDKGKLVSEKKTEWAEYKPGYDGIRNTDTLVTLLIEKIDAVHYRFMKLNTYSKGRTWGYAVEMPDTLSFEYHSARTPGFREGLIADSICYSTEKSSNNNADSVVWLFRGKDCVWRKEFRKKPKEKTSYTYEEFFPAKRMKVAVEPSKSRNYEMYGTSPRIKYARFKTSLKEYGKNNIPEKTTMFFPDGKKKMLIVYDSSGHVESMRGYYASGNDSFYSYYYPVSGITTRYNYPNKKTTVQILTSRRDYDENGKAAGIWNDYDENGHLRHSRTWQTNTLNSTDTWFDENDSIIAKGFCENGIRNGHWEELLPDGKWTSGNYKNGYKEGLWEEWYEKDKKRMAAGQYLRGVRKGKWIIYSEKGKKLTSHYYN